MSRLITATGALLLCGALPLSAQDLRVAATVRLSDHVVAGVSYGPRHHHVRPLPVVVVRPAPVVVVARPAPVVVYRVPALRHHRAHARLHRELARRHARWHRSHPPGLRVVGHHDDHDDWDEHDD